MGLQHDDLTALLAARRPSALGPAQALQAGIQGFQEGQQIAAAKQESEFQRKLKEAGIIPSGVAKEIATRSNLPVGEEDFKSGVTPEVLKVLQDSQPVAPKPAKPTVPRDFVSPAASTLGLDLAKLPENLDINDALSLVASGATQGRSDRDFTAEAQKVQIPGFALKAGYRPRPEEADKLRNGLAAASNVSAVFDQLSDTVKQSSTGDRLLVNSATARTIDALKANATVQLKEAYALGALTGGDFAILDSQLQNFTGASLAALDPRGALQALDTLKSTIDSSVKKQLATRGYEPVAAKNPSAAPQSRRSRALELMKKAGGK